MSRTAHYRIDYLLEGSYKTFYLSATDMTNAEAWHWAAVDSGFASIPKHRGDKVRRFTKPLAERCGIEAVEWSKA
jgi:hypothetical protein